MKPTNPLAVVPSVKPGAIVLTEAQYGLVEQALSALDFTTIQARDIVKLGFEAERGLHKTLDGFLVRLDKNSAAPVFALFDRLERGVNDAKLPQILKKVQDSSPSIFAKATGYLRGKTTQEIVARAHERVRDLVAGRTKTLANKMGELERELTQEMERLIRELNELETLKRSYRDHLGNFAIAAGVSQAFFEKAKVYVATEAERVAQAPDPLSQASLQEMQSKLQLLESRALALEGTYTKLPADHMVIQQIEEAGVATFQETASTAASRFASIKMTLLALHGAFAVKSVQQLNERQAALENQLLTLRGALVKEIATSAAAAPGNNRLAEALQIENIIRETQEIRQLVAVARKESEEKFALARGKFQAAREALTSPSFSN